MSDRDGHDWLCPYSPIAQSGCKCPWINQARADERERIAQAIEALPVWDYGLNDEPVIYSADAARIARNGGNNNVNS